MTTLYAVANVVLRLTRRVSHFANAFTCILFPPATLMRLKLVSHYEVMCNNNNNNNSSYYNYYYHWPRTGSGAVMRGDLCVDFGTI